MWYDSGPYLFTNIEVIGAGRLRQHSVAFDMSGVVLHLLPFTNLIVHKCYCPLEHDNSGAPWQSLRIHVVIDRALSDLGTLTGG